MTPPAPARQRYTANPLQRLWLRELGLEKLWLDAAPVPGRSPATSPATSFVTAPVSSEPVAGLAVPALAPAAADLSARLGNAPAASAPVTLRPTPLARAARPAASSPPATATPHAASIARLDLDALHAHARACTACGLSAGRKQAVFGTGAQPAHWMIVGEAPGEQEDRQGLPFVGPSGQLLDAMLAAVGHSRARDVYIANVVKCRPPGNRNPRPEEIQACRPYLLRQIALIQPACILVMGRFAAQTLLASDAPISRLRGQVHHLQTEGGEIPVIVSYHPAYLLRSPHEKAKAWADLQWAVRLGA